MDDPMQLCSTVGKTSKHGWRCSYFEAALASGFSLQSCHGQKPQKRCLVCGPFPCALEEAWNGNDSNDTCTHLHDALRFIKFFPIHDRSRSTQQSCRLAGQATVLPLYSEDPEAPPVHT